MSRLIPEDNSDSAIYVVESNPVIRAEILAALSSLPWPVYTCETTRDLLDRLTPSTQGCIVANMDLIDITLSGLLDVLGRAPHRLPLILLSDHVEIPDAVAAMRAGVQDVLPLPVIERVLSRQVHLAITDLSVDIKNSL